MFVSHEDGLKIKDAAATGVTVNEGMKEPQTELVMSDFSSVGVSSDMELKPEITAVGGNVYSSVLNNGYSYMSGTSMATPQMAGLSAAVSQYVRAKNSGLSKTQAYDVTEALLMSTATPIKDAESYYSPRKQGAGLANLTAATTSPAYLTVVGADAATPKASMKDSVAGEWSFTFTVHNMTDKPLSYTLDAAALSADIEGGYFLKHSTNYAGKGIDVTYSVANNTVNVDANGAADVTVTVKANDTFKNAVADAVNGMFVDGFVMLKASEGGVNLSVPYVGFYGDWSRPH